jgi:hypothetical protein
VIGPTSDIVRIALIHDWLDTRAGGEQVLAALLALHPEAEPVRTGRFSFRCESGEAGEAADPHVVHPEVAICAATLPEVFRADAAGGRPIRLVAL